jgi:Permuted papain-like amidase enzyme, YaeF/YiiX, C92 family
VDYPKIGDIILFRQPTDLKSPNTLAQSVLRRRKALFSHVAISVGEFFAIHAMPDEGVHVVPLSSFSKDLLLVYRHVKVDENLDLQLQLRSRLFYYFGQPYNRAFWLRRFETASYCSELAAKAYADVGLPLSHRNPKHVLPVDLQDLPVDEWTAVTVAYSPQTETPLSLAIAEAMGARSDEQRMSMEEFLIKVERKLHEAEVNQFRVNGLLNELRSLMFLPRHVFNFGRSTWLEHLARNGTRRKHRARKA